MATNYKYNVGSLRPSQVIYTFGVGALVDLPHISALVMGLEDWPAGPEVSQEIREDRLLLVVQHKLGPNVRRMQSPPIPPESPGFTGPFDPNQQIGIPVATFPRWLLCPACQQLAPLSSTLFELRPSPYHPDRTCYVHKACSKSKTPPTAVPARFLVACENGHLDDFPWVEYVHRGPTDCRAELLRLLEFGPSGEARDLLVRCETCNSSRPLTDAFGKRGEISMPLCRSRRPHLRDFDPAGCDRQTKAILLGASNLWFPDTISALAIPVVATSRLDSLVNDNWIQLQHIKTPDALEAFRNAGVLPSFYGLESADIWRSIERRNRRPDADDTPVASVLDLFTPEWGLFTNPAASPPARDFRLREERVPSGFEHLLARVVLADQLREVRALIGFTRLEAPGELDEDAERNDARRMTLSSQRPTWVPAAEVRGEGIFLQFKEEAVRDWLRRPAVTVRDDKFRDSHIDWRKARRLDPPEAHYPGMRYVLLHSVAHAIMRRFALECGYTTSSLRERIYCRNQEDASEDMPPMAGVLIYTAATDSEGTLGGLVSLGDPLQLRRHFEGALRDALLCASDPLCAESEPRRQGLTLHAAACHACLFAPETSCERGNRYLDRSTLVPTMDQTALAFFDGFTR